MNRLQHPKFGRELRALSASDKELYGIIVDEIEFLAECKESGRRHPDENRLGGELRDVGYLRKYVRRESLRVYFTVRNNTLFMLMLLSKRRTKLLEGDEKALKLRLEDVKQAAK